MVAESRTTGRRWWQYKRTWLIGIPVVLMAGVAGLFAWGSIQPRPAGFEPSAVAIGVDAAVAGPIDVSIEPVETTVVEQGPTRYTVDAVSTVDWVLFDFDEGRVVDGDFTASGWDVAFRRTKLLTNSGVTNPAGPGGAFDLGEIPLETASPPASLTFAVDTYGGEDEDEAENPAAGHWYSYSFISHIVSAKPNTYLVRTGESLDALVQFDSYYCEDEESGCITFRYRLIPKVAEEGT
jgi:hypothetical protein